MPPIRRLALLDRFQCTGPACVATCCAGWRIAVDPTERERWAAEGRGALVAAVVEDTHGLFMDQDTRGCKALTVEGWCGAQQAGGEPALPYACTVFPRVPRRWPDAVEVSATMGCPEIARLALADDGALAWVAADASAVPRRRVIVEGRPEAEQAAARRVVAALSEGLGDARWPLRTRLLQLIAAVLPLEGPAPETFTALEARLRALPPTWRTDAVAWRATLDVPLPAALAWIDGALADRLRPSHGGLGTLGRRVGRLADRAEQVARLRPTPEVDALALRHLRYLLVEQSTLGAPVTWLQTLLLHAAAVRAFVLAHPDASAATDEASWQRVFVDVAWRFARDVEHASRDGSAVSAWTAPATLRTVGALAILAAP